MLKKHTSYNINFKESNFTNKSNKKGKIFYQINENSLHIIRSNYS
jgi:hypothetical protein